MKNIFADIGLLAEHLPDYESRPGQLEMAEAVAKLLEQEGQQVGSEQDSPSLAQCLIVEAGTGLGKTLAYLIPAVLSGRRVVVSTNTRNLQDQILKREIPFIQNALAPGLRAMTVKGRQNYLCLYRWHQIADHKQQVIFQEQVGNKGKQGKGMYDVLDEWLQRTVVADRAELSGISGGSLLWQKICCLPHFCLGADCPYANACYLNRLRRLAASCQVLVVNHHLLFSDLAVRKNGYGEVLPRYQSVIIDEAHHLENVAGNFFGFSFSRYQVVDLITDIEQSVLKKGGKTSGLYESMLSAARALSGLNEQFAAMFPVQKGRFPLRDLWEEYPEVPKARDAVMTALHSLAEQLDKIKGQDEPWGHYGQRSQDIAHHLEQITSPLLLPHGEADLSNYIQWVERTEKNLTLSATPIDVAEELQSTLFAGAEHCLFTSATLRTEGGDGGFSYFRQRLGIPETTQSYSFSSPFDYQKRTLLYVPGDQFPEPNDAQYRTALHQELLQLITCSKGRALLLFTSFQSLELAWHSLQDQVSYPLLRQGTCSRSLLLERFAEQTNSVLFAVASFWEGVDVPGDSLSLVVIDKLPFEVPSDPVIMARMERIKAAGGNPFMDFQIPRAILTLRQGVGRLMRRANDRGVMAILDVRLFSKFYGRRFRANLPAAPISRDMQDVEIFFNGE
ncbi:MAG: ATP-dependent DNA helicase [Candidatus Electrothrix aestuarii]|uniref:DNA 5'-3' helicase n=1 Tax=Candidatus Electrothrix aestuarii TaxID=3062594 RepID=A0AAU8M1V0_9BACT|nr:ATP-dependent DNA helicase [Candidatus Electrothrix aestuarii]